MKKFFQPWAVTLVLYLFYLGAILAAHNGDPIALVRLGHGPNEGYDGQFTYLIAINPVPESVVEEIQSVRADVPAYRYQRILLPLLARLFGLGQAGLIVWTIPLINLIAQTAGVAVVEQLLVQLGASRWYALVYGLWPGLAVAVRADLTEPLAYLLVAIGYLFHWRNRPWLSALSFGLAILAKETAILFAVAQLGYALLARDGRRAAALIGLAVLPFGVWQLI